MLSGVIEDFCERESKGGFPKRVKSPFFTERVSHQMSLKSLSNLAYIFTSTYRGFLYNKALFIEVDCI